MPQTRTGSGIVYEAVVEGLVGEPLKVLEGDPLEAIGEVNPRFVGRGVSVAPG